MDLFTSILQNIYFYGPQRKEKNKGMEQHEGRANNDHFYFWVNYPLKLREGVRRTRSSSNILEIIFLCPVQS